MNKFKNICTWVFLQKKKWFDKASDDINWWEYSQLFELDQYSDINAAIALPQFHSLDSAINRRNETRKIY